MCVRVCVRETDTCSHAVLCASPKVRKTTETDGRRFILNYSSLLSVSWGFWSDTPLLLPRSLSCHNPSPQLFHFSRRDGGESFVPLHQPPFTSLSLMVVVAYWLVYRECIYLKPVCLFFFLFCFLYHDLLVRTQQETNDVLVFANKSLILQNVKLESKHRAIPLVMASVHRDACVLLWFVRGH